MMQGILLNCPENATEEMVSLLAEFAQDSVINNKICLARLILQCKQEKKEFDWFSSAFDLLVKEEEHDLLTILQEAYKNSPQEKKRVDQQMDYINKLKRKEIQKEKSFIASLKSESEIESDSE